jgi:hypothetical protein
MVRTDTNGPRSPMEVSKVTSARGKTTMLWVDPVPARIPPAAGKSPRPGFAEELVAFSATSTPLSLAS